MIILVRHGETYANREGIVLGGSDSPLTPSGVETTRRLASCLIGLGIEKIVSSTLGRAVETAGIISQRLGPIPVERCNGLAELSCGHWEGLRRREIGRNGSELRSTWTDRPPGGESCLDAEPRVKAAIDSMGAFTIQGSVLVVAHAVINRVFLKLWYQLDPGVACRIVQPHDLSLLLSRREPIRWLSADGKTGTGWTF